MKLAVYDMDKTITSRPSWLCWLFFYARTEAPLRLGLALLLLLPLLGHLFGCLDRRGLKERMQALLLGRAAARDRVERAAAVFAGRFGARHELAAALRSIEADRAAGYEIWLATASCRHYAEALARRWGVETVVATENFRTADAVLSAIRGENCYAMGKLRMVLARLAARPAHVRAYSDHESDLPLLCWADEAIAVSPSAALRGEAAARGFAIRDWR